MIQSIVGRYMFKLIVSTVVVTAFVVGLIMAPAFWSAVVASPLYQSSLEERVAELEARVSALEEAIYSEKQNTESSDPDSVKEGPTKWHRLSSADRAISALLPDTWEIMDEKPGVIYFLSVSDDHEETGLRLEWGHRDANTTDMPLSAFSDMLKDIVGDELVEIYLTEEREVGETTLLYGEVKTESDNRPVRKVYVASNCPGGNYCLITYFRHGSRAVTEEEWEVLSTFIRSLELDVAEYNDSTEESQSETWQLGETLESADGLITLQVSSDWEVYENEAGTLSFFMDEEGLELQWLNRSESWPTTAEDWADATAYIWGDRLIRIEDSGTRTLGGGEILYAEIVVEWEDTSTREFTATFDCPNRQVCVLSYTLFSLRELNSSDFRLLEEFIGGIQ
jgi:hypothetical protein